MWVLVAKLKKEGGGIPDLKGDERCNGIDNAYENKRNDVDVKDVLMETQLVENIKPSLDPSREEPLVARLKARMQEIREKEMKHNGNGGGNSHVCKVCFESSTATILLPTLLFGSLACSECPICRTNIADRIFAFTS